MRAFAALLALVGTASFASATPLWDYVHKDDGKFSWYQQPQVWSNSSDYYTGYWLNMTSQQWLTPEDSSRSIWWHNVFVCVPKVIKDPTRATLYITGGSNEGPPSTGNEDTDVTTAICLETGVVSAVVFQIPNEDIVFPADPLQKKRGEDALVAFTWKQYVKTGNPEWIAYFPMTKGAIKAMDATAQFIQKLNGNAISTWFTAGASKRGWTTWFTATVDERIEGIAPIVMDLLNLTSSLPHMYEAYGGWTFAFADYYAENITNWVNTPMLDMLAKQIDPLFYKQNLTIPKLICDATGDEFFMPDDDYYWWGELPGETYRLMIQNAEHSMATGVLELVPAIGGFINTFIHNQVRPSLDWSIAPGTGVITLEIDSTVATPKEVKLWHATTPSHDRRDFRLVTGNTPADPCKFIKLNIFGSACLNPIIWWDETMQPTSNSTNAQGHEILTYTLTQPTPAEGWVGFLGEIKYPGYEEGAADVVVTTQVSIMPQTFPFKPCGTGEACHGNLV